MKAPKANPLEGFTEIKLGMSNFDHKIDNGFDRALQKGKVFGRHAARNFNGKVYFEGGLFKEQVWIFGMPVTIIMAPRLRELMDKVNSEYGEE